MNTFASRGRRIGAICLFLAFFALFSVDLIKIQLVDGSTYRAESAAVSAHTVTVNAARGEIVDRYGNALVTNRQGYALVFDGAYFPTPDEQSSRNVIIVKLINLLNAKGEEWNDTLPLELDENGQVVFKADSDYQIKRIKAEDMLNLNEYATAQNCFDALVARYDLQQYEPFTALKVASVCLAMKEIGFGKSTPYTFANDVSAETVAYVKEKNAEFPGVDVEVVPYREYADGTVAPHLLGRVAAINAEEYAEKKDEGYGINDDIGKDGLEAALESYLRGKPGKKAIRTDANGAVTGTEFVEEPQQGNTVQLTVDSGLQKVLQDALRDTLLDYSDKNDNPVPPAGAGVVIDCNTGEILASATYPTYDISTYSENYAELAEQEAAPLWNRALMSSYATGSTMKPSVAIAALEEGLIDTDYTVYCNGSFTYYDQHFKCEQNHDRLNVNVVAALKESCNVFFYVVGDLLGITKMNEYRTLFGFGQATGCELKENIGRLDSPEYRAGLGQSWLPGFTIQSAIGQAGNLISPIQLANYCATIANGGTRYRTHFVKSILKYDNSEIVLNNDPEITCETGISQQTMDIVRTGMHQVCTSGYCYRYFHDMDKHIDPAAKTGTSQEYRMIDGQSTKINNGFLITYAPYEEPQIAMALVGEGMTSGVFVAPIAKAVYEYYFAEGADMASAQGENTLLG